MKEMIAQAVETLETLDMRVRKAGLQASSVKEREGNMQATIASVYDLIGEIYLLQLVLANLEETRQTVEDMPGGKEIRGGAMKALRREVVRHKETVERIEGDILDVEQAVATPNHSFAV